MNQQQIEVLELNQGIEDLKEDFSKSQLKLIEENQQKLEDLHSELKSSNISQKTFKGKLKEADERYECEA